MKITLHEFNWGNIKRYLLRHGFQNTINTNKQEDSQFFLSEYKSISDLQSAQLRINGSTIKVKIMYESSD